MTKQEFEYFKKQARKGDFIAVRVNPEAADLDDIPSVLTEFGTGECCHIELLVEPLTGAVISANGKEVAIENWDKYEKHMEVYTLYLLRLPEATQEQIDGMVAYAESRLHTPYNWTIIRHIAEKDRVTELPLVGFWVNKWIWGIGRNNAKKPEGLPGTICSKEATLYVRRIYPDYLTQYNIDDITPTTVWRADPLEMVDRT